MILEGRGERWEFRGRVQRLLINQALDVISSPDFRSFTGSHLQGFCVVFALHLCPRWNCADAPHSPSPNYWTLLSVSFCMCVSWCLFILASLFLCPSVCISLCLLHPPSHLFSLCICVCARVKYWIQLQSVCKYEEQTTQRWLMSWCCVAHHHWCAVNRNESGAGVLKIEF